MVLLVYVIDFKFKRRKSFKFVRKEKPLGQKKVEATQAGRSSSSPKSPFASPVI